MSEIGSHYQALFWIMWSLIRSCCTTSSITICFISEEHTSQESVHVCNSLFKALTRPIVYEGLLTLFDQSRSQVSFNNKV